MRRPEGSDELPQDWLQLSNYIRVTVLPSHYKACESCDYKNVMCGLSPLGCR